jgi:hypothetical protein
VLLACHPLLFPVRGVDIIAVFIVVSILTRDSEAVRCSFDVRRNLKSHSAIAIPLATFGKLSRATMLGTLPGVIFMSAGRYAPGEHVVCIGG